MKINQDMLATMKIASRVLRSKGPGAATAVIQRALQKMLPAIGRASSSQTKNLKEKPPHMRDINPPRQTAPPRAEHERQPERQPEQHEDKHRLAFAEFFPKLFGGLSIPSPFDESWGQIGRLPGLLPPQDVPAANDDTDLGHFLNASYSNQAGTRSYKLFIPSSYHGQALPLVVMLHGCTQNPDDFALGTGMNRIAEEQQCLVAYPAQSQAANSSKCWNWFNALDQQRDQGEPSIIAGITREIMDHYSVDPRQVFIAGMSAGGAMAVILGSTYPDLYAAVGIHSGLPYAAAQDLPSALSAMKGRGHHNGKADQALQQIPVIVFHGDLDNTVSPRNGDQIIAQSLADTQAPAGKDGPLKSKVAVESGRAGHGHAYTRTVHSGEDGKSVAEQWLVHGVGHAWSGGSQRGTYTDPKGPDAAREMMRFFSTHPQPQAADADS
ncbi:MAG: PHB depolymerase family esterase [Pseudomonadota bacterium]